MAKELNLLDQSLLEAAASGKSGEEIEKQTGVPAAQAIQHIKNMLKSRDIWTEMERRQLLLRELHQLKDILQENAYNTQDPAALRLLLQTLQTIGDRLDSEKVKVDYDMMRITDHHAKIMGKAFDVALEHMKRELQSRYPDVSKAEIDSIAQEGLVKAKFELIADTE